MKCCLNLFSLEETNEHFVSQVKDSAAVLYTQSHCHTLSDDSFLLNYSPTGTHFPSVNPYFNEEMTNIQQIYSYFTIRPPGVFSLSSQFFIPGYWGNNKNVIPCIF